MQSQPLGTAYHRAAAVNIAADAFRLPVHYVTARADDGAIVAVLPLVEQSSVLFGRYLVSVPYFTYGGVLATCDESAQAVATAAVQLAERRRARHVEMRHVESFPALGLRTRLDKVSMVLPLPATEGELSKQLGSKLRSQIKRADREAPEIQWGAADLLDEFYRVFASGMHQLGTPVYARKFFHVVAAAMGDLLQTIVVRVSGRVEAAAILIRHGDRIEVPWAVASPAAKRASLNMRMYWEMLRYCISVGAKAFDFGRSTPGSGTYKFKEQWGAKPIQLHWHYWLRESTELPVLNHSNPKYARAAELWRRMPLWCANLIGPHIARYLP